MTTVKLEDKAQEVKLRDKSTTVKLQDRAKIVRFKFNPLDVDTLLRDEENNILLDETGADLIAENG